ncbi:hypothetical protein HYDPIDRAFT_90985 [Hydnomerulius pinastri MD-312]|uniref:ubiquitinyl hydrolase 1 n=1 Tax=Hydnomerulius pinastri MD-312 TaxID=994086 RepID=A0A0C9WFL5_9AGAM|nr:hypothetical protein HYDPIDRAFT_90985 [Hydnomerulius pinastri MD-312]
MSTSNPKLKESPNLGYIITHVFCPLRLPDGDDHSVFRDHALAEAVCAAARAYTAHVSHASSPQWEYITDMLHNLSASVKFVTLEQGQVASQLSAMKTGDNLAYLIRAQNAAVVFRKQEDQTIFEAFEVSPMAGAVMGASGKLLCSYPGPAIAVPNGVFDDGVFRSELAAFLAHMNEDILDSAATSRKAGSTVVEERDTTHPRYITELLTGILRGVGRPADVNRISKRIGDDVVWNNAKLPWRRSSLWLVARVALQTSLERTILGRDTYKVFMIFFMYQLTQQALEQDLPSELLHFMSSKLSRRLMKLGSSVPGWLSEMVLGACTNVRVKLEARWEQVRTAQAASPRWAPFELRASDTRLSLLNSQGYIRQALDNQYDVIRSKPFKPEHRRRGTLEEFLSSDGNFFKAAYVAEPHLTLYDVEQAAVGQGIDGWVACVTDADDTCVKLEVLADNYSSCALKTYKDNPENLSIMLLTTVELWIALDKVVVNKIPILAEYSPEVPTALLERLLLHNAESLHRLQLAYRYIRNRHSQARSGWSAFSDDMDRDSFPVRYYSRSPRLQLLRSDIEEAAQFEYDMKVDELNEANALHVKLKRELAGIDHVFVVDWYGNDVHASMQCPKCELEGRIEEMKIVVHEWPLPALELHAIMVVFELDCPISFNMWRSATLHLLTGLCSPSQHRNEPYIELKDYPALQPYHVKHRRSRVSLASDTKPVTSTHYSVKRIPSKESHVCVANGLTFYGFDNSTRTRTSDAFRVVNSTCYCTYQLQSGPGPYENLQEFLAETSHTSNQVLANQAECHKDLSLHEFIAFGHLRSGPSLQLSNILLGLHDRTLSFRRDEVHLLVAQAVSQVGPLSHVGEWTWHQEFQCPSFCDALLSELQCLLSDVEENWLEGVTMKTVAFLLSHLLASNLTADVSRHAFELLRHVREKTFACVQELSAKLTESSVDGADEESRWRLRDMAAICRSTFNAGSADARQLLHSPTDVEVLLSCAVLIHDNSPRHPSSISQASQLLLERDRRLSLALEDILSDLIDKNDEGIDLAVTRVWPAYRPGTKWMKLEHSNSRWFSCQTAKTKAQRSQQVHFNLHDGSLLVDGKPLGRLPNEITMHPVYSLVFGNRVLDVLPGDVPGMEFSTRGMISGYQVYFTMKSDELIIRAKAGGSTDVLEVVPQERLESDLPMLLVKNHVHWLNLSTSTIEVRPLEKAWEHSGENWVIDFKPKTRRSRGSSMRKGSTVLVDIRSQTWTMVSSRLKPLELPENLVITRSPGDPAFKLSVELPCYGLSFFVDEEGELQSHNMRDMVYDENQSTGTMFGLVNQLVLRPKIQVAEEHVQRCVLIPDGKVSFAEHDHHVRIEIHTHDPPLRRVTYQTYKVDTDLGCLKGNVSLTNKLYRAYLHALSSSGCSTDPLTGKSGTEEALSILRSASCQSFMKIGLRDVELLGLIASLVPVRTWYPKYLQHMQKVEWLCLPTTSQHHGLYGAARAIKEHCEKVQVFHEGHSASPFQRFPTRDPDLLERSALRAAHLHPLEFCGLLPSDHRDAKYQSRDFVKSTSGEHRAHSAASVIYRWSTGLETTEDILGLLQSWNASLSGKAELLLHYDSGWLSPDLPQIWITVYNLCRRSDRARQRFQLLFSLPAMAYGSPEFAALVPTIISFATNQHFCLEDPPSYPSYDLSQGFCPSADTLLRYISTSAYRFEDSPESSTRAREGETVLALRQRQLISYNQRLASDAESAMKLLVKAWPSEKPPQCHWLKTSSYDVTDLTAKLRVLFVSCYGNLKLKEHLVRVQKILDQAHSLPAAIEVRYTFSPSYPDPSRMPWVVAMDQLLSRGIPTAPMHPNLPHNVSQITRASFAGSAELGQLIAVMRTNSGSSFQREYLNDLHESVGSLGREILGREMSLAVQTYANPTTETLKRHYLRCRERYFQCLDLLRARLSPGSLSEKAVYASGQFPRIIPETLFRCLASTSAVKLSEDWQEYLLSLALLFLEFQRSRRLLLLDKNSLDEELSEELENKGCDGWDAKLHPDWLLIQLEGNFLIRRVQANVASEMISPQSGQNTSMQLHMGEGKSSVIVPIAAAALADGEQLVRVVVPKALTAQMFQLLVDRLGGLANRRIYYLPFSRSLKLDPAQVRALQDIMLECKQEGGIIVVQPDHVLSLKLMSVEKQLDQAGEVAGTLLKCQRWLHSRARDLLDESDEIFHVRYQLVYTVGLQKHLEGFPDRWTTTQQVLSLVRKHAISLRGDHPLGLETDSGTPGSFPHTRILQINAGQELISRIAQDVMNGLLPNFSFDQFRSGLREAIHSFISCKDNTPSDIQMVQDHCQEGPLWGGLLLLRGLLASGILLFALQERRWRVDYGLAPSRTMLAVPYRAKDMPAPKSEFGHPDVAIVLTCLSYYYGGLTEEQLRTCFEILLKQDNPSLEYELWVRDCPAVPDALRTLNGINIKSSDQWQNHLHPLFAKNQAVIDFYLSRVVFPKEAKEFPSKLSCSGWDLAERRGRLITGFSGTNDGRYLLPTSISQRDPDHQRGTNARVLAYLLQPENNHYMLTARENGERRTALEFLQLIVAQTLEIRVLLDVGAQMLELSNHGLVEAWLKLRPDVLAGIYFNEDDELTVLARDGSTQLLLSSPFAQQLDQCIAYLDDAHTRGTDIRFPTGFRAAVTLGPKFTKDRLTQGCMRMRKLGHGHSLMFFAPLEVDRKIRWAASKSNSDPICVMDVLQWAIHETCNDIQHRASHWAQHGIDHASRYHAWSSFCEHKITAKDLSNSWLQPEAKTLEDLYSPGRSCSPLALTLPEIRQRCLDLGILSLRDASLDEEQEREVIHEIERERQVERPRKVEAAKQSIHKDVRAFVKSGVIPVSSNMFRPAFATLAKTTAAFKEYRVWSDSLLVTEDFCRTIGPSSGKADDYLRPVNWILSSNSKESPTLVIISPCEANSLMPHIRLSKNVHLHVYTPRTTESMKPCDNLNLYSIPPVPLEWTPPWALIDQLNVFAGQLYLRDHATYIQLCRLLCIYAKDLEGTGDLEIEYDGFIAPENRLAAAQSGNSFRRSPLPALKALIGLRRKGMRYAPTHMGKILDGRLLTESDFRD